MPSIVNQYGWIILDIPESAEEKAIALRKSRDEKYGNIYTEEKTDERWVGDLGEFVLKSFLSYRGIDRSNYQWILEDAAGKADFIMMDGSLLDVKTVKRKVPVQSSYTAQITAQHINEDVQHYFFMSYQNSEKKMTLLGGISKSEFKRHAVYYGEGAQVHSNYTIRKGHEIYNIDVTKLIPPHQWLDQFI
ncbi:hypothetical protein D5018_17895 [Parashewanella curva]|uniref:Uncharacterized protein n=1 Tax=Parashewanella curva TaxID=2338552 RepID=A0A3L8PST3_9GAMM|nr:hypothetical protein [Parashewanella curva]RLV58314.1 hypothetical protein D5018_17895 [Parashewanella curva]